MIQASLAFSQDQCTYIDQALYANEYRACLRMQIASSANVDCVSCLFAEQEKSNPWVEALGIVAAPLASFPAVHQTRRHYAHLKGAHLSLWSPFWTFSRRGPLSLSYDHRIIDGADAARFLRWICEAIEQPVLYFS